MGRRPLEGRRDLQGERKENEGGNGTHMSYYQKGPLFGVMKRATRGRKRGQGKAGDRETIKTKYNNYMCENVIMKLTTLLNKGYKGSWRALSGVKSSCTLAERPTQ